MGQPVGRGVEQRAGPEVVDDDRAMGVGERGDLGRLGRLGEAGHREVGRVDAQDRLRPTVLERRLEVGRPGAVGRPDLDQLRAGPADDVGDPDAAADLDELAARDDDPARPTSATASATAAALLFVTSASSAPVSAMRWSSASRPRARDDRSSRSISRSK